MKPYTEIHATLTVGHLREFVARSVNVPDNTNIEALTIGTPSWGLLTSLRTDKE